MTTTEVFDVQSLEEAEAVVNGTLADIEDKFRKANYQQLFIQLLNDLAVVHAGYFARRSSPVGIPWAPLKPQTVSRKGHDTILEETLALKESLTTGRGGIRNVTHRGLLFGTEVDYGIFHQTGTSRMPQREFLGINDAYADRIVDAVADYTIEELKK